MDIYNNELRAISHSTGGYSFRPDTLKEALHLNELETVLSLADRDMVEKHNITLERNFQNLCRFCTKGYHHVDQTKRKPELLLKQKSLSVMEILNSTIDHENLPVNGTSATTITTMSSSLPLASSSSSSATQLTSSLLSSSRNQASTRRILYELRQIQNNPHPSIDIYPCESNLGFWKVIIEGPDSTVYKNGVWLIWVKFPTDYPLNAPEIRFETPIRHCNVNAHGKICHRYEI